MLLVSSGLARMEPSIIIEYPKNEENELGLGVHLTLFLLHPAVTVYPPAPTDGCVPPRLFIPNSRPSLLVASCS